MEQLEGLSWKHPHLKQPFVKTLIVPLKTVKSPTLPKPWNKLNIFIASPNIYSLVNSIVVNQATVIIERSENKCIKFP